MGKKEKLSLAVCTGKGCKKNKSETLFERFRELLEEKALDDEIQLEACSCLKKCKQSPAIKVMPGEKVLTEVKPKKAEKYLKKMIAGEWSGKSKKKKK